MRTLATSCRLGLNMPKKSRRDSRVVAYIRLEAKDHAKVTKIARKRGRPHTFASVAAEMLSKGLATEPGT